MPAPTLQDRSSGLGQLNFKYHIQDRLAKPASFILAVTMLSIYFRLQARQELTRRLGVRMRVEGALPMTGGI